MDAADAGMGAAGNPEQGTVPDSSSRSEDPTQHAKAALYGAAFACCVGSSLLELLSGTVPYSGLPSTPIPASAASIHKFLRSVENSVEDKATIVGGRVLSASYPLCPRSDAHSTNRKSSG